MGAGTKFFKSLSSGDGEQWGARYVFPKEIKKLFLTNFSINQRTVFFFH